MLNQLQEGTAIGNAAREQLAEWDFPVFSSALHSCVTFSEAVWQGQSVIEYQPKSKAAAKKNYGLRFSKNISRTSHHVT